MNAKERLGAIARGEGVDRIPFMPTILEHAAKLIGRTPSEAATDAALLENAHIAAFHTYSHDMVTVGIDIYNIEAEALGCDVRFFDGPSIPGIVGHPLADRHCIDKLEFSCAKGRIHTILSAASGVLGRIGQEVPVAVAICGPFSIAVELCGYDGLVGGCVDDPHWVHALLDILLEHQKRYCDELLSRGLGITIFESWATPPLLSPSMYAEYAVPYETGLIGHIKSRGAVSAPLVIGGDTTPIIDDILSTGTTLLVADYMVDLERFLDKAAAHDCTLRGNIDPKIMEKGDETVLRACVDAILEKAGGYRGFVLGTGVVSYDTPKENISTIRRHLETIGDLASA